ncbi:MAG: hypothetical protein RLZZ234_704 [Candidatus Parcubacteria bacterium]
MITNNEFFSKFDGANKTRYYDMRIAPEERMKTPQSLTDIIAILTRTEPADESKLDDKPPKRAVNARYVGEAPLPLRHLWNEYVTLSTLVKSHVADELTCQMHHLVADMVILGLRDVYGTRFEERDTFFITAGWHVYLLAARQKAQKQQASLH